MKLSKKKNIRSTSSIKTEKSQPRKESIQLGKELVDALIDDDRFDPLGRWMIHQVADMITEYEATRPGREKNQKLNHLSELIFKIWEHRSHFNERANPASSIARAVVSMQSIGTDAAYWQAQFRNPSSSLSFLINATVAYNALVRTILTSQIPISPLSTKSAMFKYLTRQEKNVVTIFEDWLNEIADSSGSENKKILASSTAFHDAIMSALTTLKEKVKS